MNVRRKVPMVVLPYIFFSPQAPKSCSILSVDTVFAGFGGQFVSIAMVFFVFSTVMAYYFYAESGIIYLFQGRKGEKLTIRIFQALMLCAVIFGAVREADVVWQLGDIGVGLMAWVTVISILILCPQAIRALKEFEKK